MATSTANNNAKVIGLLSIPVLVAALGYFVDIYDLLLFGMIRKTSLQSLGLTGDAAINAGLNVMSVQMYGLLIGGILWGIMGDKKGRLSVLFGSIILYSLANIANGFVHTLNQYEICRFIAGIGLAGELGAGITLVSELIPKEKRGIATSMVAGIGLTGAVVAYFISQSFDWRICYFIGGGLGFLLLLLRVRVFESGMFHDIKKDVAIQKGNFLMFFTNWKRFKKYILAIAIGLPTWHQRRHNRWKGSNVCLCSHICCRPADRPAEPGAEEQKKGIVYLLRHHYSGYCAILQPVQQHRC